MTDPDGPGGADLVALVEAADDRARNTQVAGLDPAFKPLVAEVGGLTVRSVTTWPAGPLHSVTGLGVAAVTERSLEAALTLLARAGVSSPMVSVVVRPDPVAGPDPQEWLRGRGFEPAAQLRRFVRDLDGVGAPEPTDVRVDVVGPEAAAAVAAVSRAGFGPDLDLAWWKAGLGRPGWVQVLARLDGEPVGTGALFVDSETAWLGGTATVPAARRRGVHRAMIDLRVSLAAQAGAVRVGVLAAESGGSARNLQRLGFDAAHAVRQWRRPHAAAGLRG